MCIAGVALVNHKVSVLFFYKVSNFYVECNGFYDYRRHYQNRKYTHMHYSTHTLARVNIYCMYMYNVLYDHAI